MTLIQHTAKQIMLCLGLVVLFITISDGLAYQRMTDNEAKLNVSLSPEIQKAIDSGIELTFLCDLKIDQEIFFLSWPKNKKQHKFLLKHHELSNRYIVQVNGLQASKSFHSSSEATEFIVEQSILFLNLYQRTNESPKMRIILDKYELPGPIRLNAFISNEWHIDTGWTTWTPDV